MPRVDVGEQAENQPLTWLDFDDGRVAIEEQPDGRRRILVQPEPGVYVARSECVTRYPPSLITRIAEAKTIRNLCDEIAREEDPMYVSLFLRYSILGYVPEEAFRGARILDVGSGSGASTVVLARMSRDSEIVGVELEPELTAVARLRAQHYGLSNLLFVDSPNPETLPEDLGEFDFINLGAVYEHLSPNERARLLSQLWSVLRIGGVIFISQLPFRFYPVEAHTTGLPLLNYLPDRLAHFVARRFSSRVERDVSWPELLRRGIRGGTARSVRNDLLAAGGEARTLHPCRLGLRDHADLWYGYSAAARPHVVKHAMRLAFRLASGITRSPVAPGLSLAFEKRG